MSDDETELAREQAHVDRAYARLEVLREQARRWTRGVLDAGRGGTPQARLERDVLVEASLRRLAALALGSEPLVFGRLDARSGERLHVGRVAVPDADLEPLVVDWRAPAAAPFYRATAVDPLGLVRRRHLRGRGPRVVALDDEVFDGDGDADGDGAADQGRGLVLVGEGALMETLRRERSGRMRDIVATIQREQDEVIRAPLAGALVVQGGPGTGKTAVAVHRAAYLLYTYRDRLEHAGVLLIGPTQRFVRYLGEVLPALGEQAVRLGRLRDLVIVPGLPATLATEPVEVAALKGDGRMARVLVRALRAENLSGLAADDWPHLPVVALRRLLASPRRLEAAAHAVLRRDEWRPLLRPAAAGWTAADLPLLDELAALVAPRRPRRPRRGAGGDEDDEAGERDQVERALAAAGEVDEGLRVAIRDRLGRGRAAHGRDGSGRGGDERAARETFAHVLVDEAQDLSAMEWRMLVRRCPSGSMTIVGDLAQATAPGALASWDAVAALLGGPVTVRELSVNYRTPTEIAEVAARVLSAARLGQDPPTPVRATGVGPDLRRVPTAELAAAVTEAVRRSRPGAEDGQGLGLVAVLTPDALVAPARTWVMHAGLDADVLPVRESKGLEFDAVVVLEPAGIIDELGVRGLYLAVTRPTQRLTVLSTTPLPPALTTGPARANRA